MDRIDGGTRSAAQRIPQLGRRRSGIRAIIADVDTVKIVVAHGDHATLRVGDVFLKIDADQSRTDIEVAAMAMAPVPTPHILWRDPPVLALAAVPGAALGHLGQPSTGTSAAWAAAGGAVRALHDAPLPPWPGRSLEDVPTITLGCTTIVAGPMTYQLWTNRVSCAASP